MKIEVEIGKIEPDMSHDVSAVTHYWNINKLLHCTNLNGMGYEAKTDAKPCPWYAEE